MNRSSLLLFFISSLLVISTSASHAQSVKTGAKGGINFATFSGDNADYSSRTGFMLGGFVKMGLPGSPMSIQPEIYYSQKGAESNGSEITLEYVEVPILFKFGLSPTEMIQPNIFVGPYAGINLSQDSGGSLFGGSSNGPENIDFGGVIGAGLDIEAGTAIFTIDARYGFGMTNVFETGNEKNRVFAITAGISLPGK